MNFLLDHIELHIDDSFFEVGERLLAKEAMQNLFQSEKNLWLATFKDGKLFEVEIQLVANRVKAMTCDCAVFEQHKACAHTAAVLIELRKIKVNEKEEKEKVKVFKPKKSNQKITVHSILQNISQEELNTFVRAYARSNRNFSIALKTKFATNVEVENSQEKYLQVINAAISVHKTAKGEYSPKSMQHISKLIHQMFVQAEDVIALKNYAEGFSILEACMLKVAPLLRYNPKLEENQNLIFRFLQISWELYQKEIAPTLRERIWDFIKQEAFKTFYFQENLEAQFFHLLLETTDDSEKVSLLTEAVSKQLETKDLLIENKVALIAFQLALFEKSKEEEKAEALMQAHLDHENILVLAIEDAVKKQKFDRAKRLYLANPDTVNSRLLLEKIDNLFLKVALQENDVSNILKLAEKRFLQTYDFQFFEHLQIHSSNITIQYEAILEQLKKHPYSTKKRDVIAELHFQLDAIDALFAYFESIRSLDLLQQYDAQLIKDNKKRVYSIYEDLILEYVRNHIGRKSSQKTSNIIQHLRNIGARDLADKLVHICRTDYSERHTLMEELQFF